MSAGPPALPGRALVILPYFGVFGPWIPLFLHSLASQHTLDLLLVTDGVPPPLPANARCVQMRLEDVRELASLRLGTPVCLPFPRKLCDLRPAFGLVFDEFTRGYDYWAFGDEDVLYGDLDRLLAPLLGAGHDLVVPSRTMTVGHLTIVRNAAHTNALALRDPQFPAVLASEEHWAYDESSWARGPDCSSFTRTVREAEAAGAVRVHWGFPKRGDLPWLGRWFEYDGRALRENDDSDITYYHWGRFRGAGHAFPGAEEARDGFAFDRYGFYGLDLEVPWRVARQAAHMGSDALRAAVRRVRPKPSRRRNRPL